MTFDSKSAARELALRIRGGIPAREKAERDERICERIAQTEEYQTARTLLLYAAVKGEPDLSALAFSAMSQGKTVAYPVCMPGHALVFRAVKSLSELQADRYSIPAPADVCPAVTDFSHCLCVVPGVCFSHEGERIGYGGGYYDRFLAQTDLTSFGVTYKELVFDSLPADEHDIKVDAVFSA